MRQESLLPMKETYEALEEAALDLYGFAMACHGGAALAAEPQVMEALLLGLENVWFTEGDAGKLTHKEFREDFFRVLWQKSVGKGNPTKIGGELPLGHEEMAFYQLPQLARAALFLRTKKRFAYPAVAMILGVAEPQVQEEVEKAREYLLGRRVRSLDWNEEEDF